MVNDFLFEEVISALITCSNDYLEKLDVHFVAIYGSHTKISNKIITRYKCFNLRNNISTYEVRIMFLCYPSGVSCFLNAAFYHTYMMLPVLYKIRIKHYICFAVKYLVIMHFMNIFSCPNSCNRRFA